MCKLVDFGVLSLCYFDKCYKEDENLDSMYMQYFRCIF